MDIHQGFILSIIKLPQQFIIFSVLMIMHAGLAWDHLCPRFRVRISGVARGVTNLVSKS